MTQQAMSMTRQQAAQRLQAIQAQIYVLSEEAKTLSGFLNGAQYEDQERAQQLAAAQEPQPADPKQEAPAVVTQEKEEKPADQKQTNRPSVV